MSVCPVTAVIAEIKAALQKLEDEKHLAVRIPLRNKKGEVVGEALVDREDEWVGASKWYKADGYATGDGRMHIAIMGEAPEGMVIDHKNNNRLDNRRANLRFVSRSVNAHNVKIDKSNTGSRFTGVYKRGDKWSASLKHVYLGLFEDETWAAWSYNVGVYETYGALGRYNIIEKPEGFVRNRKVFSGLPRGVTFLKGKYVASIHIEGRHIYLGRFETVDEASRVYEEHHAAREAKKDRLRKDKVVTRDADGPFLLAGDTVIRVSECDWHFLAKFTWGMMNLGYPMTQFKCGDEHKVQLMHILLLGTKKGLVIDHRNLIKTDNRRENLRFVTRSHNGQNTPPRNILGLKGVTQTPCGTFAASIVHLKVKYNVGNYADKDVAAYAYDCAALQLFGEHAYFNKALAPDAYVWDPIEMKLLPKEATVSSSPDFHGVHPTKSGNYMSFVHIQKKFRNFGTYKTRDLAAYAYNCGALQLLGTKAKLNDVLVPPMYRWDSEAMRLKSITVV
jgi:hypothetical protein